MPKSTPSFTRTFADVSTAHITQQDAELLQKSSQDESGPIAAWSSTYGHLVFIPDDIDPDATNPNWPFSKDFWNTLTFILDQGINYVLFDRDAEVIPNLPTHDW